jgi:hypothetical protein
MSNVKIQGNASGTGTLTIAAPNTNTDRTLTLPDAAGEIVTASGGVLPALDGSNLTGISNGITHASMFRLTTDKTSNGTITNLEEVDDATYTSIGTPMTESSGIFTFPVTGIWQVIAQFTSNPDTNDTHNCFINVSTNSGASYTTVSRCSTGDAATRGNTGYATALIDCTDTSTFRVAFEVSSYSTGTIQGNTTQTDTGFTFIRLGGT